MGRCERSRAAPGSRPPARALQLHVWAGRQDRRPPRPGGAFLGPPRSLAPPAGLPGLRR